jgi:hypothetical protein
MSGGRAENTQYHQGKKKKKKKERTVSILVSTTWSTTPLYDMRSSQIMFGGGLELVELVSWHRSRTTAVLVMPADTSWGVRWKRVTCGYHIASREDLMSERSMPDDEL